MPELGGLSTCVLPSVRRCVHARTCACVHARVRACTHSRKWRPESIEGGEVLTMGLIGYCTCRGRGGELSLSMIAELTSWMVAKAAFSTALSCDQVAM